MSSFIWYVTDNIRGYINSIHNPLDDEYIRIFVEMLKFFFVNMK
jgi:hypothetical protein